MTNSNPIFVRDLVIVIVMTLNTYRVKGKYGGELRPKMGAPTMLSDEFEEDIALFVKHMEFLRVPVQKDHLREDIVHYCNENKLKYPKMPKDGPGKFGKLFKGH